MAAKAIHRAPKGTEDLLPGQASRVVWLTSEFMALASDFGFQPIATPAFEETEVFQRSVGEATDIVSKEMYTFEDRGGRSMTLRPEGTAPVIRAFIEHGIAKSEPLPWKVAYSGEMWRYERPQAGRMREFRQVGAESVGSDDAIFDVEIIDLAVSFLTAAGAGPLELILNSMGDAECRPGYSVELKEFLTARSQSRHGLCEECERRLEINPLRVLDCKQPGCKELIADAPRITESLCQACGVHFNQVTSGLAAIGIEYSLDPGLVRGLDYYTRTTFEIRCSSLDAAQDALGGGGRYDGLAEVLGGERSPAIGFAIGIERTLEAMRIAESGALDAAAPSVIQIFVMPLTGNAREPALKVASGLRAQGIATEIGSPERSARSQMRLASRLGAVMAVMIGDDEVERETASLRPLGHEDSAGVKAQESVPISEAVSRVASHVGDGS